MTALAVSPLTPTIGAEITGIDLNEPLARAMRDAIYRALLDHLVVFFRDQNLSPQRHAEFAASFGELGAPHPVYPHVPGFERIVVLANDASNPPDTDSWHTDLTYKDQPPFASILVAREVPPSGGDTIWTNMYAAFDALPDAMKGYLRRFTAVHEMGSFRNNFTQDGLADRAGSGDQLIEGMQRFGSAVHRVVQTHPATGREFLYVNEGFTAHIVGMRTRDSRRLLAYLYDHIDQPEFQVRFRWRDGSVAMWDNRCTQHYAVADYMPASRCMHRVTVVNDRRVDLAAQASSEGTAAAD